MTALATNISEQLSGLPSAEQVAVLREVRASLEDLRARKAYNSYLTGESEAGDFEASLKRLGRGI